MISLMRTIYFIIVLVWPMALLVSAQQPDEATAAAIRAKEREWLEAQSHNNNQALNLILDNALVYVEYGRLVSKGDCLSRIRQQDAFTDEVVMDPPPSTNLRQYRDCHGNLSRSSTNEWQTPCDSLALCRYLDTQEGWLGADRRRFNTDPLIEAPVCDVQRVPVIPCFRG